jgi:hypothetical protein
VTVIADRETVRQKAHTADSFAFNDNELETNLPTMAEVLYLRRGLNQAGGKLPLFDMDGQSVSEEIVQRCLSQGWAEPWFHNPMKPDWLVCKLTPAGRRVAEVS